jgi:hypothetical protein
MLAITRDGKRGYTAKVGPGTPRCNRLARRRVCVRVPLRSPKGTALPGTGENRQYKRSRRPWRSFSSPFPGSDPAEMRAFRVDLRIFQKSSYFSRLNGGGRGIRTPVTLSGKAVFKTACFNRSHIPPYEPLRIDYQPPNCSGGFQAPRGSTLVMTRCPLKGRRMVRDC